MSVRAVYVYIRVMYVYFSAHQSDFVSINIFSRFGLPLAAAEATKRNFFFSFYTPKEAGNSLSLYIFKCMQHYHHGSINSVAAGVMFLRRPLSD